jgi:uncharacterized protein YmfQ (DUF2313 family)
MAVTTADEYLQQLQALLPPGPAWSRETDAMLTTLLSAFAQSLAAVHQRADELLLEMVSITTHELLADMERVTGLPDPCIGDDQDLTVLERRSQVVAKFAARGGQSPAYFVEIAKALGYEITVSEYRPFLAGFSAAGDPAASEDWNFVWQVNASGTSIREFICGTSVCGEPLRTWGNKILECVISRLSPAHTRVQFAYGA